MPIRIDALDSAASATRAYVVPAMKDGATVKLTVGQIIDLVVDAAPDQLDTLNELSSALGNDANFSATVLSAIAAKADAASAVLADVDQSFSAEERSQIISNIGGGFLSGFRNVIINPLLDRNQRVVSGTVVLAAGAYGHDRFKAGAGGCTYTFSTNNGVTTLNISSGTLQQVIEASCFSGRAGTYFLSWTGTATARINSGSYGASGAVSTTCDGSANVTVEWATGTLSLPQFERGFVSDFSARHPQQELALCQRYCLPVERMIGSQFSTTGTSLSVSFPEMRAAPTGVATTLSVSSLQLVGIGNATGLTSFTAVTTTTKLLRATIGHNAAGAIGTPADATTSGFISAEL